jgi:ectoine hydroxylase-related dioxygenase (phytanoyl-CoA dioxygenase family)
MPKKLTNAQLDMWNRDGYLVLRGVLPKTETSALRSDVDRLHRKYVLRNPEADATKGLDRRNILAESDRYIKLIDHRSTFGIVQQLMGPWIQLSMAQALVRIPNPKYDGYVHTDGGQALSRIRVSETSAPLQIKIQYFLTDVNGQDRGNFVLFPGSHLRPYPHNGDRPTPRTPGSVQIEAKAGDAAIFPHALWHGVAPNKGRRARKSLIYCYSHHCFRQFDFNTLNSEVLDRCTKRQKRLLGDLGADWRPGAYFYSPKDQEQVIGRS